VNQNRPDLAPKPEPAPAPAPANHHLPPLSLLQRVSILFARVPAFGYGLTYLALIPLYGLVYFLFFPNDFYHSTATREQAYFTAQHRLSNQLLSSLVADLQATYDGNLIDIGDGGAMCIDRLRLDGFDIDNRGTATFQVTAPIVDAGATTGDPCSPDRITSVVVLTAASDLALDFPVFENPDARETPVQEWVTVRMLDSDSHTASQRLFAPPFRSPQARVSEDGTRYEFAISPEVARQLQVVLRASQGFPAGIPGNLTRMLYLSATTVTTTGYGDIVPITARARFLAISEAILGLVIVGLFLNSIAQQRQRHQVHHDVA
jgi:hypothetical protein